MKGIIRNYLINLGALWVTSQIIPAVTITGGAQGLATAAFIFMLANILLIPFIKILLLPLNLLTLGLFAWLSNVLVLYLLALVVPNFKLLPYNFPGVSQGGFTIPAMELSTFQVAILASFIIGFIVHFIHWLVK